MFTEMSGCENNKLCFSLGPISNFQIDLQSTFNIWECLYQSIAIRNTRFCTKLYIHSVSLLNNFQRGFLNIVKDTQ